jgi:hypothetical protein
MQSQTNAREAAERKLNQIATRFGEIYFQKLLHFDQEAAAHEIWLKEITGETKKSFYSYLLD